MVDLVLLLLRWWRLLNRFYRLLWLAPALHLWRTVPRNGFSRLGGPLVSFHIVLFLGLAFLDLRLGLLGAPAVLLIPRVTLAARLVVLPLLDLLVGNWRADFRGVTPIGQGLLLALLLVIESFRRIGLVPAVAGEFLIAPVLSKTIKKFNGKQELTVIFSSSLPQPPSLPISDPDGLCCRLEKYKIRIHVYKLFCPSDSKIRSTKFDFPQKDSQKQTANGKNTE